MSRSNISNAEILYLRVSEEITFLPQPISQQVPDFKMSSGPILKQIAAARRKPDMTRKEYFNHRYRVHGHISDDVEDVNQKPE